MKRILIILAAVSVLAGCTPEGLRNGDLVFVGIPADYTIGGISDAIGAATSRDSMNIIHAAIAEVQGDSVWIIDATLRHGVDRHPLDTFFCDFTLKDGSLPQFTVMRLKGCKDAGKYVKNAKRHLGKSYNNSFMPCDTALYCTELIRDSYVRPDGGFIFSEAPMNFRAADGTMPVYWEELFAILGVPVPQGVPGTNPKAMMSEACLRPVDFDLASLHR